MAQERPSTPEKQLLDLIENPKERDLNRKKIKRGSFSLFSLAALKGRFSFLVENVRSGSFLKKVFFDIKGLNRILRICIVLLFFYVIGNFAMSVSRLKNTPDLGAGITRGSTGAPAVEASAAKISDYLEGPRTRNIFRFGDEPKEDTKPSDEKVAEVAPPVEETQTQAEKLAEKLGLVGIGWSDNPDVMVENVESKKMYFLKRGERIDGLIKVEAIFQDKVILTYDNGKELELR